MILDLVVEEDDAPQQLVDLHEYITTMSEKIFAAVPRPRVTRSTGSGVRLPVA